MQVKAYNKLTLDLTRADKFRAKGTKFHVVRGKLFHIDYIIIGM